MIAEFSDGTKPEKTYTGYMDEIWRYCIEHTDKCVFTGKKPQGKVK